ncbi:MAG: nucleotidyltransferase family protein [Acetatifactor sp.]|nr:nucleotidyltransferase family protein [Acetatifactor sp.]
MVEQLKETERQILYLIACALQGYVPRAERLGNVELDALYRLAKKHKLRGMICMALESGGLLADAEEEERKRWTDAKNKTIRYNLLLDAEKNALFQELRTMGAWHMPLKGSLLRDMYPKLGMREMADNDILFDAAYRYQVKDMMLARGYSILRFDKDIEDIYEKPPAYNIEMHVRLLDTTNISKEAVVYFDQIKKRLISDGDGTFCYHFNDEDFFLYFCAHAYKHFFEYGTGLRTLADFYVLNRAKKDTLDWEYIWTVSRSFGCDEYIRISLDLTEKLFADPEADISLTEKELDYLSQYIDNGAYGSIKNSVRNKIKAVQPDGGDVTTKKKLIYVFKRIFIDREFCRDRYPFVFRHPYLLPFLWVFRIVRGALFRGKRLISEWKMMKDV